MAAKNKGLTDEGILQKLYESEEEFLEPDRFSEGTVLHCFFKMARLRVKYLDADPGSGMETVRIRIRNNDS
jgi:hypothetical protein